MFEEATGAADRLHRDFFAESGDYRQVWALDVERGAVFYLADGAVDNEIRAACRRGSLRCPLPGCPDSRFVAHGGDERRHHFAHRVAHTPHKATTVWRAEAVAMLADWARRYRGAVVTTRDGPDVAEVVIRSERSGRELTLAVTYNRSYAPSWDALADPDRQLLLGHTRGLLLPRQQSRSDPRIWWCGEGRLLSDLVVHREVALAVNPERRLVATLMPRWKASVAGLLPRNAGGAFPIACFVDDLDACALQADGIVTPPLRQFREQKAAYVSAPETGRASDARRPGREELSVRGVPQMPPPGRSRTAAPTDPRQVEYLRRAEGKTSEERLALLKEIFLPDIGAREES